MLFVQPSQLISSARAHRQILHLSMKEPPAAQVLRLLIRQSGIRNGSRGSSEGDRASRGGVGRAVVELTPHERPPPSARVPGIGGRTRPDPGAASGARASRPTAGGEVLQRLPLRPRRR
jgi:hypothetical protein